MRKLLQHAAVLALATVVACVVSACGGGGSESGTSGTPPPPAGSAILSFRAPTTYTDNEPLVPGTDTLDPFEIYVNETGVFGPNDIPIAYVDIQPIGQLDYSWELGNLAPYLSSGVTYYACVRAVAKGGAPKSEYSASVAFSL
jgi:hypothetical protein